MSNPAASAMRVEATKSSRTASMSARVISRGVALLALHGMEEALIRSQLPDLRGASITSQPSWVEPLRPEWPIWQQILASVSAWVKAVMRAHASRCSGA